MTGDIGYADADGYFYITDRKKDMLLVNGINVYPREIEEVLYQFPGVKEAARHRRAGCAQRRAAAGLRRRPGRRRTGGRVLLDFSRERLADYKVPRQVVFMPALPRNATGKILKTELREMAPKSLSRAPEIEG